MERCAICSVAIGHYRDNLCDECNQLLSLGVDGAALKNIIRDGRAAGFPVSSYVLLGLIPRERLLKDALDALANF